MALFRREAAEEPVEEKTTWKEARAAKKENRKAEQARIQKNTETISQFVATSAKLAAPMAFTRAAELLRDDEEVLFAASGEEADSDAKAVLVATDQRIFIATSKNLTFGQIELPYINIDRIDVGRAWRGAWVTLFAGSQETRIEKVVDDMDALKDIVRERQLENSTASSAPASSGADEVQKLAELHTQGILSDDEFAAAKKKVLGL